MGESAPVRCPSSRWSAAGKVLAAMILQQLVTTSGLTAPLNQTGRWVATPSLGFSGTHVVLLREPGSNNAKMFLFGESGGAQTMRFWRFAPGDTNLIMPTTVSARSSLLPIPHPTGDPNRTDLFCSGHATLPDGHMVLIGGDWLPTQTCEDSYTLDAAWNNLSTDAPAWTHNATMAVQRWYATATPLSDGRVLTSAGTSFSGMIGFGGLSQGAGGAEVTDRVLRPLELSARFSWGDTTLVPANCPASDARTWLDNYTNGQYPPGREGHGFAADYSGRAIIYGGRRKLGDGSFQVLNDVWMVSGTPVTGDSAHAGFLLEQIPDPIAGLPTARWDFAMTWAGVEKGAMLPESPGVIVCYIQGGKDAVGNVLGDLWRGERIDAPSAVCGGIYARHFRWQWTRILAGDASTKRFGHAMMFDPGYQGGVSGSPHAKLIIYGGRTADGAGGIASNSTIYLVDVGSQSVQPGQWRSLALAGARRHTSAGAGLAGDDAQVQRPERQRPGIFHLGGRE